MQNVKYVGVGISIRYAKFLISDLDLSPAACKVGKTRFINFQNGMV